MDSPPDVVSIGRIRLVSIYEVSREFGACPISTRKALEMWGVPILTSPANVEYVELLALEHTLAKVMGLSEGHVDRAGRVYSALTREAIRARLTIKSRRGRRKRPRTLKRRP